ncbi:MAG: hypothetical protein K9N52_04135 [Verrucomicrobia bacterium]|nr:hypothetical protein [Verrucomicrobiota bacterium]
MPDHFPPIQRNLIQKDGEDRNPAVQTFGRRFFVDQTVTELLIELLLVASSIKRVAGEQVQEFDESLPFPPLAILRDWPEGSRFEYSAKARLNLKLFSFLGASKLETRHESHRQHYRKLIQDMSTPQKMITSQGGDRYEMLKAIENLFLGFQGVGGSRTWCAQSFIPLCREMLAAETLWNETQAKRDEVETWAEVTDRLLRFFSLGRHRFLARGGELLYLQICNALRQQKEHVLQWNSCANMQIPKAECDPAMLHADLSERINAVFDECPSAVGKLAEFIDSGIEKETAKHSDGQAEDRRFTVCGWCPTESWREGYLFAMEVRWLCQAKIDPVERLELLETACALQVLRSLGAQSARHVSWVKDRSASAAPLGYVITLSDPEGANDTVKQISRRGVDTIQRMIHDAIRNPAVLENFPLQQSDDPTWTEEKAYREADRRYGHKLFLTLAKRIGMIVPRKGQGARFVLSDKLLRCLVLSLVPPGKRITYETFKHLLYVRHAFAVDSNRIGAACEWYGTRRLSTIGTESDAWLVNMLETSGMLIRLSDSCSLVKNPFEGEGET